MQHTAQLQRFRQAVASLADCRITVDVARALEFAAFDPIDQSINLDQFASMVHHGFTFLSERFASIVNELHPLHCSQWQETEMHRHGLPFQPDYERAARYEQDGALVQFTIRRDGGLVGHMRLYLQRSMHTGTVFAQEDTLYIDRAHRGNMLGLAFLRYIEAALEVFGVSEIRFDVKLINKASVLLDRLRYKPVATRYVKIIKE